MKRKRVGYLFLFLLGIFMAANWVWSGKIGTEIGLLPIYSSTVDFNEYVFPDPDKTTYVMDLNLEAANRNLHGKSLISTVNTSGKPLAELWLTMYPNAFRLDSETPAPPDAYYSGFNPGGAEVKSLTVNGQETVIMYEGISLGVILGYDIMMDERIDIAIEWTVKVPRASYRLGTKNGTYMLSAFYPQLNVLDANGWKKSYNSKFGDPFCSHSAEYLVHLDIPEQYVPIGMPVIEQTMPEDNGRQRYTMSGKKWRSFALALMFDYSAEVVTLNKTSIRCFVPGRKSQEAKVYAEKAKQILNYFNGAYGSYPYKELNIVFVPMKGFQGMEHSGLVFINDEFLEDENLNDQQITLTLAHEIAHQWWYGVVGNDQMQEPWLDEGLANWSAYKYYINNENGSRPALVAAYPRNLARGLNSFSSRDEYYKGVYNNGAQFWFELENQVGEEKMTMILHRYWADYQYKIATTQDLFNAIHKEVPKNIDAFLNKWFF
ncbi:MAG: M1 family metallopeptidase [Syntrophomonadaceae bacterium]|jgi:hypothetical protein|nr:M1 family metallopeptidase [Syntrophomonadaceae bacterium]